MNAAHENLEATLSIIDKYLSAQDVEQYNALDTQRQNQWKTMAYRLSPLIHSALCLAIVSEDALIGALTTPLLLVHAASTTFDCTLHYRENMYDVKRKLTSIQANYKSN